MKFAIAKQHRDFFHKNQCIEFTDLLNEKVCQDLISLIDLVLSERMNVPANQLNKQNSSKLFMAGHDLWRGNESIRKIVTLPRLAEIAAELIETMPLRLGYDQLFPGVHKSVLDLSQNLYSDLLTHVYTLEDISSMQGVLCGLMLCLSAPEKPPIPEEITQEETKTGLFSLTAGSGVYFSPKFSIDFNTLATLQGYRYLMIVYVHPTSVYILKETDLHTHALKRLGYVFGDRLSEKLNPIVYR